MSTPIRRTLEPPEGFRSREIGLFVSQLEDQSRDRQSTRLNSSH